MLFSGQAALPSLVTHSGSYAAGTLALLLVCKGLAYGVCLGSFRGGPIFPAMFLGAAGGLALSHLPGLEPVAGAAMGIGALCVVMLGFPLVSVLLATLFDVGRAGRHAPGDRGRGRRLRRKGLARPARDRRRAGTLILLGG